MIVRLTADVEEYMRGMKDSQKATKDLADKAEETQKKLHDMASGLSDWASGAIGILGQLGVAMSLGAAYHTFEEHEQNAIRMNAAIEAGGHTVASVMPEYKEFAEALSRVSTESERGVMNLLRQAETMGKSGVEAESVARIAVNLAGATGQSAASMMRAAMNIKDGNFEYAKRVLMLRGVKDATEVVTKVNQRMAAGQKIQEELAKSGTVQLQKLGESMREMTINIGGAIASVLNPVIQYVRQWVDWFNQLNPVIKGTAATVVSLLLAFRFLPQIISMLTPIWTFFSGFLSLLTGPWLIALIAVGIGVTLLIKHFGSWQDAVQGVMDYATNMWSQIQTGAMELYALLLPTLRAIGAAAVAVWNMIVRGAEYMWGAIVYVAKGAWDWILRMWNSIFGEATFTWQGIADSARDFFIAVEWAANNMEDIMRLAWAVIKYDAVVLWDFVVYTVTVVVPAAFTWMQHNFWNIIDDMVHIAHTGFTTIGEAASALPDLIAGNISLEQYARRIGQAAIDVARDFSTELFVPPAQIPSDLQEQLRREYEELGAMLGESWLRFYNRRVRELSQPQEAEDPRLHHLRNLDATAQATANNVAKHMHKLDGSIFGSAEALNRLQDYESKIREERTKYEESQYQAKQVADRQRRPAAAGSSWADQMHEAAAAAPWSYSPVSGNAGTDYFTYDAEKDGFSEEAKKPTYQPIVTVLNNILTALTQGVTTGGAGLKGI